MAYKIKFDKDTYECSACGYRWSRQIGKVNLSFDKKEHCPDCGELIENGNDC